MSMPAAFRALDIVSYTTLAKRLCSASVGLAFCDRSAEVLVTSDERVDEYMTALSGSHPAWASAGDRMQRINVPDGKTAVITMIFASNRKEAGFLVWWLDEVSANNSATDLYDALLALGACVRNELLLQTELDSMALELSERYEELNLVYHTDDQVSYFREGYEAFQSLVRNCADYLDAGLALLYLRDKNVLVVSRVKSDEMNAHRIRSTIDSLLYARAIEGSEIRFFNNDDIRAAVPGSAPYRLMACPIRSSNQSADGVLVIANPLSTRPFSNSDKNLLLVMARKAGKIIQGSYDGLTGTLNRTSFEHLLDAEVKALRGTGGSHGLMHLNIDKLHRINDTIGHEAGDMVIRRFTQVIAGELRDTDSIARVGGDEIGVLIRNCNASKCAAIAEKLLGALRGIQLEWGGAPVQATASIGVALVGPASRNGEEVMKHGVVACGVAKEAGGDRVQSYASDDSILQQREASMWMVGTVQAALRENSFLLYGQPIVPRDPGGVPHLEVLLRLNDGEQILSPNAFLPASERYQVMSSIDRWVVENALMHCARFMNAKPDVRPVISINLSGQSFCAPEFLEFCQDAVSKSGVPPEMICFEITESAAIANRQLAQKFIKVMRGIGCCFALDDFGAGLSSFGYLKSFDVQYLKIDGTLVRDIVADPVTAAMVESVNQIGHTMGLQTVAEFVETAEQRELLRHMGVDFLQGYLLGKPGPLAEQLAVLGRRTPAVTV